MATGIKFICFGSSVENLRKALDYNIIGLTNRHSFTKGEPLYFAIKTQNEWKVCGRAKAGEKTDVNPFGDSRRFYTYTITEFEACIPFNIKSKSQEILGIYWALNFQSPRIIDNEEYCSFILDNFTPTDNDNMLSQL